MNLDAYFERIGYAGPAAPTLDVLHALTAAHAQSIPFENIDVLLGRAIDLTPEALFEKLVIQKRGGYCFEQNGLFLEVLTTLGFRVTPLSGRVRLQRPRDFVPPRTHLFLRVEIDGEPWITDVGVGSASLTAAIRFAADIEQPTPNELRRVVLEEGKWFHQVRYGDTWNDIYDFTGEDMPFIDRVVANWYTSAHPASHFRNRLVVARALPEGRRRTLLNDELTLRARDGTTQVRKITSHAELLGVLDDAFGLRLSPETRLAARGAGVPWLEGP